MTIPERIERDFARGWTGTADDWWKQHPSVVTINSVAPTFTFLKQAGRIEAIGRKKTRAGGLARVYRAT